MSTDQDNSGEQYVRVPRAELEALLARSQALETEAISLRQRLGELMLGIKSSDSDTSKVEVVKTVPTVTDVPKPHTIGSGAVELFSRTKPELDRSFTDYEKFASARAAAIETVQQKTAPFVSAFSRELYSRGLVAERKLPPCPSFDSSPEEYKKYINKHGKTIRWQEEDEFKRHDFSLTFLPREIPELVRFTTNTHERVSSAVGGIDTNISSVTAILANSSVVALSSYRGVSIGSYRKPFRIMSSEYKVDATIGDDLTVTHWNGFGKKQTCTYAYDLTKQEFIHTANDDPSKVKPPISPDAFLESVDDILKQIPTLQ